MVKLTTVRQNLDVSIMASGNRYGITLKQLRELMEFRGREGVEKIKEYGGVHEIAKKLQTSEKSGESRSSDFRQIVPTEFPMIFG